MDNSPATTGDGSFVLEDTVDLECPDWVLDPPPHDKSYFKDHLEAANNYWQEVSNGNVSVNLDNSGSMVFPDAQNGAYQLPHDMLYYHPYLEEYDETAKLFELSADALALADSDINFNDFTTVIIVHAGMGGDFAFALDPTPGNIPSAYLSTTDFDQYGTLTYDGKTLDDLIIIPESQNFLQFSETRSLFAETSDPCFYQVGLNGTIALMLGFHLGLPPLYNTESGKSLVGGFALMDQGSNNFHGIVPAYPDPYSRIKAGWVISDQRSIGDTVSLGVNDDPVRISITNTEYYLIENRQRNQFTDSSLLEWIDEPGFDTVSVELSEGGVVLDVDEQHAGLPGNGLYIWHVDETAWNSDDNPNGGETQLVDFVEADGAQDMGHATQLLFAEYLETGWWFDPWFAGNEGWFHLNRNQEIIGDSLLSYNSTTFPSTHSNTGIPTHLSIENISPNGSIMSFSISSDRMVRVDSIASFIGWDDQELTLWGFDPDSSAFVAYSYQSGDLSYESSSIQDPVNVFSESPGHNFTFRYPWIVPETASGIDLFHIESATAHQDSELDSLYEMMVSDSDVSYFAQQAGEYVTVNWQSESNETLITDLSDEPLTRFESFTDVKVFYGDYYNAPIPAGTRHIDDPNHTSFIAWDPVEQAIRITNSNDNAEHYIAIDQPKHIIPIDADDDGEFEIALFYANSVRIINQAGHAWSDNPFAVDAYHGNPIIANILSNEPSIFLRHEDSYSIHSLLGELLELGVMHTPELYLTNSLRNDDNTTLILSGQQLLYFPRSETSTSNNFWIDPQGNTSGDRVSVLSGTSELNPSDLKLGATYNYPNPIKGNTTRIRAWLGEVDTWTIEIFSLSGAQIAYSEQTVIQHNSFNEWVWDASSVSNGVFLAQIQAGNKSEIIKIAIIR